MQSFQQEAVRTLPKMELKESQVLIICVHLGKLQTKQIDYLAEFFPILGIAWRMYLISHLLLISRTHFLPKAFIEFP